VTFSGPAYDGNDGPVNGPAWSFDAPHLPAVSRDGKRLMVFQSGNALGAGPNLDLLVKRVSDGKALSTTPLLDVAAFDKAHQVGPGLEGQRRAYDALREKVVAHVLRINAELTQEGWEPLVECRVDIGAGATQPACSMKDQEIQCGSAVHLVYREPQLEVTVRGRSTRAGDPRRIVRPESVPGNQEARYPIRGCAGAAWLAPTRGLALLLLQYECQGAGDGCSVPDRWEIVHLPTAPGLDPPPGSPGAECPRGMIAIPAGSFTMGSPDGDDRERPPHPVQVNAFCLDATEVSVADYHACLKAGRCFSPAASRWAGPGSYTAAPALDPACNWDSRGRDAHPMNCTPWSFAQEYCDAVGKRLPTEEEWEYAARGPAGVRYPWGAAEPTAGVCWNLAAGGSCAVGKSAADRSPFGVMDLGANVAEWTSTPYVSYDGCWPENGMSTRGGFYAATSAVDLRGTRRDSTPPATRAPELGFRCARSR